MAKKTFWDIIEETIKKVGTPLSAKEIWDKANSLKITDGFKTKGKTPWSSIAAYCYTDINSNGNKSTIIQTSERPALFFLRSLAKGLSAEELVAKKEESIKKELEPTRRLFHERDLHPLLVSFAYSNSHFKAYLKTIRHEESSKTAKGVNKWLHPDVVGVYFPFNYYKKEIIDIQEHLSVNPIKLFSFEIKIDLNFGNLREYYFQAVSNSSWANEGYLVVLNLEEDPSLRDEIRRLNNAFGIGVLVLNTENIDESEILFPSSFRQEIDWDTVNRLASENTGFSNFLNELAEDIKVRKVKSQYDKVLSVEALEKHLNEKGFVVSENSNSR